MCRSTAERSTAAAEKILARCSGNVSEKRGRHKRPCKRHHGGDVARGTKPESHPRSDLGKGDGVRYRTNNFWPCNASVFAVSLDTILNFAANQK